MGRTLQIASAAAILAAAAGLWLATRGGEAPSPAPSPTPTPTGGGEPAYRLLRFPDLAFPYDMPMSREEAAKRDPYPKAIRALDGARVEMLGGMHPIRLLKGKAVSLYLIPPPGEACCVKGVPQLHEFIRIDLDESRAFTPSPVVLVRGILRVREEWTDDGFVDTILRIEADQVEPGLTRVRLK